MKIFFSIIIPLYNRRHLIKPVIDSVLNQTYKDFELILIDDGSSDNTGKFIADNYQDKRIKYFYKVNEERGAARNFGLQKASGNYAVFLDSDDLMMVHYLSTLSQTINEHPEYCFLAAKYNFLYPDGEQIPSVMDSLEEGFYDFEFFLAGNGLGCNFCIRLIDFDYKMFPPERELASMEDWLFLLLNTRKQPIFIKDVLCVHMQQHDDRSMLQNQKVIEARKKATQWVLKNISLSSAERKKLLAWSHYFCGVHHYLDNKGNFAVSEAIRAIRSGGVTKKFLLLLGKALVGRRLIKSIK